MTARFHRAAVSSANLDLAMLSAQPHLKPIVSAIRNYGIGMLFVPQDAGAFRKPRGGKHPTITLIGDDFDSARGPEAFHAPSLRRAIRASHAFAVISSAPQVSAYASIAVTTIATRRDTLLIETRPEMEIPWLGLIQKLAPGRHIWLATIEGGRA